MSRVPSTMRWQWLMMLSMCLVLTLTFTLVSVSGATTETTSNQTSSTGSSPTESADQQERDDIDTKPFLELQGLYNGVWAKFFIVAVASSRLAFFAPKIGLPLITGYMFIGVLCGPFVMGLLHRSPTNELLELQYVTQFALAFISFSAGSELYLPELRSLFKRIAYMSLMLAVITMLACTFFIYAIGVGGLIKWYDILPNGSCQLSVSSLAASIMVARSPASAIAVIRELRAKGPITSTMLGVTVCGDVVVLILFTLTSSISTALCEGSGFEGGEFLITLVTLLAAVMIGYGLGYFLILLLWIPRIPGKYTILPLGFLTFVLADWFTLYSTKTYGVTIAFDALLICITAGYVITNRSKNRIKFLSMLGESGPYIFIPFFTKVGIDLNLTVLAQSIAFGVVVFFMRAICVFLGSFSGGSMVGMLKREKLIIWTTMLAQAGVSLGLASEVAVKFPSFGPNFQTTVISVILINQLVGPVLCKWGLRKAGEAGKMSDEDMHDEHGEKPIKRALIVGVSSSTLAVAQRLLNRDWHITLYDTNQDSLTMASHHLSIPQSDDDTHGTSTLEPSVSKASPSELDDDEGHELEPSSPSSSHTVTVDPTRSSRIQTSHIPPVEPDDDTSITSRFESMTAPLANDVTIKAAVVELENDTDVYDIASYLTDHIHVPNVVARIHNPTWGAALSHHGVIPIFDTSLMAHVLLQTMISKSLPISLTPPATSKTQSIADSINSVISPVDDWVFTLQTMEQAQRDEYEQLYPDSGPILSLREARAAPRDLRERLTDVTIGAHVSEALKQKYLDQLHAAHSLEDAHVVNENDAKSQSVAFLTPSQFSTHDEEQRLRSKLQQSQQDTH